MGYQFIMRNSKRVRNITKHVILTHSVNLIENFYISPDTIVHNNFFTAGVMEDYFMRYLKKRVLPYHYYIDNIGDDWYVFKGACEFQPSYFLEDLVQAGVIKYEYLDSIVIVLSDDFSRYPVDNRMSEHLCDKVLSDIMRRYRMTWDKIVYIDDCLQENWKENLRNSTLQYNYKLGTYFDFQKIKVNINKFKKN